jgi:hypothetical protein
MLFNKDDIQGGFKVKQLAKWGATKQSASMRSVEGPSVPLSTVTEHGSTVDGTAPTDDTSAA